MIKPLLCEGMIRLRQIALVARDLDTAVEEIRQQLDVDVCYRDPGVGEFGLHNALFRIGDQFLEVVSPIRPDTTAGRLLEKAGTDCGYMAIFEVDDLDTRMDLVSRQGVRVVWSGDFRQIRGRHLHPKDTGGTLVSLDQPEHPGAWHWGGPTWREARPAGRANSIVDFTISTPEPQRCEARWQELGIDHQVRFQTSSTTTDVLSDVSLVAANVADTDRSFRLCGVNFTLTSSPNDRT